MPLYLYIYFILLSGLVGIVVYFQKPSPLYLKLFPPFLIITFMVEITGLNLAIKGRNTQMLYNVFSSIEFVFYLWFLSFQFKNKFVKTLCQNLIWIYPLLVVLNKLYIQKTGFHTYTYSLGCLLIVALCIYYFFELFKTTHSIKLTREPTFWIISGLLFFYSCSYPFFAVLNFWKNPNVRMVLGLVWVTSLLNIFLYSSILAGFLCRIKIRNSLSSS
ncbi:MAG: hypothetical protein C5B52_07255 [Bacteroidetes bacterium]|nr:MAG: hypothetical protein C5B52_07255 [Bacteroidota bacterium]